MKDTSVSLSTSVSSPSLKSALSSDTLGIDDSMSVTPASPSVAQSPRSSKLFLKFEVNSDNKKLVVREGM